MKNSELKQVIRDSLGIEKKEETVAEAYASFPKKYNIPTELLSKKAKEAHEALYEEYTRSLTNISAELDGADRAHVSSNGCLYRTLKQDEIFNRNAVYLHELFFANMSDVHSEIMVDSLAFMRIERDFGKFDDWQFDFLANAKSSRSGWVVCGLDLFLRRYVNFFVDSHNANIPLGFYPVIVLDMHEHSFYRDYLNNKDDYIKGQMQELNWMVIEERFKRADLIMGALEK